MCGLSRYAVGVIGFYLHCSEPPFVKVVVASTYAMTKTLRDLKKDGLSMTPEVLKGLSPYRTEHINLLGDYTLDTSKRTGKRFTRL